MKRIAVIIVALTTFAFTSESEKPIKNSKITWKGYKVTGSHEGTLNLKSGVFEFENDRLIGGEFTIDMTSISNTDLDGEYKQKLEGHLKSDDFFGVTKFPEASLSITKLTEASKNSYNAKGNITIKGNTNSIDFTISIYGNKASVILKIDRSKFDVRYGSPSFFNNLKDKAIYDEFDIIADLEF
ncbi:MAG: YceI family protein [Flavobacteriaceae bacterium]|nr:YceI family protein [Flavobacteriaceae bacterium]